MKKTRIGVIGIGHQGQYHLNKYQMIDECVIAGVSDIDENCTNGAAENYGCCTHTDYRDLIGKVDAVSIAVPTHAHYRIAKFFLVNGIDVLLEKPIATTKAEADELINLSRGNQLIFQIGFIERFNPAITALARFIEKPMFIEAHRLHPFFNRGTDIDVILDLMIHDLDIILHLVNSPVDRVEATGISVLSKKVDIANARITFKSGCVANVTASRVTNKAMQKIRFFSEQGYNSVDYAKRELISLHRRFDEQGQPVIEQNPVSIQMCDPLEAEIRSFLQAVRTRQPSVVSGEDARPAFVLALDIIEQIHKNMDHWQSS